MKLRNFFKRSIGKELDEVIFSGKEREVLFEEIEEKLVLGDLSVDLTEKVLSEIKKKLPGSFSKNEFTSELKRELKEILLMKKNDKIENSSILPLSKLKLDTDQKKDDQKKIIFLVGVNGSGKTTTAAKLGYMYKTEGKRVLFAASDTFRAAGGTQLEIWGNKIDVPVISGEKGADPGSVLFNALNSFKSKVYDILIVDTAGRVQSRENLMKELSKLVNIVKKFFKKEPSDILLVIDTTMGQNTVDQARKFTEFTGITGIILAKIDGTAKGGTVIRIADETGIPVRYVGTGETEKDLAEFSADEFLESLIG